MINYMPTGAWEHPTRWQNPLYKMYWIGSAAYGQGYINNVLLKVRGIEP